MEEIQAPVLLFAEPCWYVLDRIITCAQYRHTLIPYEAVDLKNRTIVKVIYFAASCGLTEELWQQMFKKENRNRIQYLKDYCDIGFPNSTQVFDRKKIEINLAPNKSRVPIWTSGPLSTQHDTILPLPSTTSTVAPPSTPPAAPTTPARARVVTPSNSPVTATSVSLSDLLETVIKAYEVRTGTIRTVVPPLQKSDRQKVNEVYAERVENVLEGMMMDMITVAQNMQRPPNIFLQGIYTKIVQKIRVFNVQHIHPPNIEDTHMVDALRNTLATLNTRGSRTTHMQHVVASILTCVLSGDEVQRAGVIERLGVGGWRGSIRDALRRREDLRTRINNGENHTAALSAALQVEPRNQRSDTLGHTFIRNFWHDMCRLDTDSKRRICVVDSAGNVSYCTTHVQFDSTVNLYQAMKTSNEYLQWVQEHSTPERQAHIGICRFREGRCPCIVMEKQRDCADVIDVQYRNYGKAEKFYRTQVVSEANNNCNCQAHSIDGYRDKHKKDNMCEYLLCAPILYPGLERTLGDNNGMPVVTAAQAEIENITNAKVYLKKGEVRQVLGMRATTARAAFEALKAYMPQPAPVADKDRTLYTQTSRKHVYVVDITKKVEGDEAREDIIVTNYQQEKWDCKKIPTIQSQFHIHVPLTVLPVPKVAFRKHFCWCTGCRATPPTPCLHTQTIGEPVSKDVVAINQDVEGIADDLEDLALDNLFVDQDDLLDDEDMLLAFDEEENVE